MQLQCLCLTDESPADHRHHTKQLKLVPFLPAVVTCTLALLVLLEPSLLLSTSDIFMLYGCEDPLVGTAPLVSESPTARTLKVHLSCVGHTAHVSAPEVTLQMLNNSSRVAVGTPSCRILRVGDDRLLSKQNLVCCCISRSRSQSVYQSAGLPQRMNRDVTVLCSSKQSLYGAIAHNETETTSLFL